MALPIPFSLSSFVCAGRGGDAGQPSASDDGRTRGRKRWTIADTTRCGKAGGAVNQNAKKMGRKI